MKYLNDVNYKDCVGRVFKSKSSGDFKILKYNDSKNVEIQFLKTGFETSATLDNIRNGKVKDPYSPSVFGVGIVGNKYLISEGCIGTKEYVLWKDVLRRCYSDDFKKKQPTYKACEVSGNFKSYEYFYEWCSKQIGFSNKGWHSFALLYLNYKQAKESFIKEQAEKYKSQIDPRAYEALMNYQVEITD